MSENIVLTTGIYDLIKEHLRRRKTKREARKAAKQHIVLPEETEEDSTSSRITIEK